MRPRIVLTGFMGVGKSSVARHLAEKLKCERLDLDILIERDRRCSIAAIIDRVGVKEYRRIESDMLRQGLERKDVRILSLGGGTWTIEANRRLIKDAGMLTVWLEADFDHCWQNIRASKKERPLARDKDAARQLFEDRRSVYCLADWHFLVRPGNSSFDVAEEIIEQIFS